MRRRRFSDSAVSPRQTLPLEPPARPPAVKLSGRYHSKYLRVRLVRSQTHHLYTPNLIRRDSQAFRKVTCQSLSPHQTWLFDPHGHATIFDVKSSNQGEIPAFGGEAALPPLCPLNSLNQMSVFLHVRLDSISGSLVRSDLIS
jgi:hypothetical protein